MPVTLTVLDSIAEELVRRLTTLTVLGTEQTHVTEVIAPCQVEPYTPKHLQIVVKQGDAELVQVIPGNPPAYEWDQPFQLLLHVMQDRQERISLDGVINRFWADVQKVITQPQTTWHQFDGNAINAVFGSPTPIVDGALRGKELPLIVTYRVSETDPYEVRA